MTGRIVVDTSIVFSVLLHRRSRARQILGTRELSFYSPRFVVVELFKHKERIATQSELSADELLESLNAVINRMALIDESIVSIGAWVEARRLCAGVDEKDTPFVALALHLECEAVDDRFGIAERIASARV